MRPSLSIWGSYSGALLSNHPTMNSTNDILSWNPPKSLTIFEGWPSETSSPMLKPSSSSACKALVNFSATCVGESIKLSPFFRFRFSLPMLFSLFLCLYYNILSNSVKLNTSQHGPLVLRKRCEAPALRCSPKVGGFWHKKMLCAKETAQSVDQSGTQPPL